MAFYYWEDVFLKGLESVLLFVLIIISSLKGNRQNVVIQCYHCVQLFFLRKMQSWPFLNIYWTFKIVLARNNNILLGSEFDLE